MPQTTSFPRSNLALSLFSLPFYMAVAATLLLIFFFLRWEWTRPLESPSYLYISSERSTAYDSELAAFYDFAAARKCDPNHPMYEMIFSTLEPYESEGISDEMIERALLACRDSMLIEISETETQKVLNTTLKPGSTNEGYLRKEWFDDFFEAMLPYLPNTKFVMNLMDEPCSWKAPLTGQDEAAYAKGDLSLEEAWLRHGCDSVGMAKMKDLHGFFVSPATFPATREKVPIWSWYSIPGCFSDLLGPNHGVGTQSMKCPPPDIQPFSQKEKKAIFRGSTSGGAITKPGQGAEQYSKFHRLRLAELSKELNRSDIDAGITGYIQCEPESMCDEMEQRYGKVPRILENDILNDYAYHILVDGNGALNRLARYMCSASVPILGCIMQEWYYKGMKPYKEYLPLDISYNNLVELVEWAQSHPEKAEEIGRNAARFAQNHLRMQDMQCYTFRQIVEYNKLKV